VDHQGVPNVQLVKEDVDISRRYNKLSVAEQHAVDLSWELLMDPSFDELRSVIYNTPPEKRRFRQLLVNAVMATDIVDKELKELRNARWDRAFHGQQQLLSNEKSIVSRRERDDVNRKATIVIEHLMLASDVSHTMQHWHIYRKWNERLFAEMVRAYELERSGKDPSEFWYQGELGFFDFYIIPLAKKLKECGVFGVSSAEYLNYATTNRREWELKGKEIVEGMIKKYLPTKSSPEQNPQDGPD